MTDWDEVEAFGHGLVLATAVGAAIWIVFAAACGAL
jgi:hypothetical protein